jgi:hypothetical protein
MKTYMLSIYQPDGPPPPPESLGPIMREVIALRNEMDEAGVLVLTGGLTPATAATVLRVQDGKLLTTDGPFTESKEHLGGFTILRAPDRAAALDWAGKLARATTLPIEVRPFQDEPHR